MRRKEKLLNNDKHGCYVIVELHLKTVPAFLKSLNRRLIHSPYGMTEREEPVERGKRDIPCIKDFSIFLRAESQIAYIVLFFWEKEEREFIDSYLQKLRRRYRISSTITFQQLKDWSNSPEAGLYYLPGLLGYWAFDSLDIMTLWLSADPASHNAYSDSNKKSQVKVS